MKIRSALFWVASQVFITTLVPLPVAFSPLPARVSVTSIVVSQSSHRFLFKTQLKESSDVNNNNNNRSDNNKKQSSGYQFGDVTKSLIKKVTKKDTYEFGDLSRHVDSKIKDRIAQLNNKDKYEFGDLTKYVIQDFTNSTSSSGNNNNNSTEYRYKFGDVTKEIIKRVKSRDYTLEDLAILIKILTSFGVGLSPVASFLPMKLLLDLLNYSIAEDVGTRVVSSIALEIDKRMKKAITGDESYQLGDYSKKVILNMSKTVIESMEKYEAQQKEIALLNQKVKHAKQMENMFLQSYDKDLVKVKKDLEDWDETYLQKLNNENTKQ